MRHHFDIDEDDVTADDHILDVQHRKEISDEVRKKSF